MAAATADQKKLLELILDGAATFVLGYLAWTLLFGQQPIKPIHDLIAILGTGALAWLAWKSLRRYQALK